MTKLALIALLATFGSVALAEPSQVCRPVHVGSLDDVREGHLALAQLCQDGPGDTTVRGPGHVTVHGAYPISYQGTSVGPRAPTTWQRVSEEGGTSVGPSAPADWRVTGAVEDGPGGTRPSLPCVAGTVGEQPAVYCDGLVIVSQDRRAIF